MLTLQTGWERWTYTSKIPLVLLSNPLCLAGAQLNEVLGRLVELNIVALALDDEATADESSRQGGRDKRGL